MNRLLCALAALPFVAACGGGGSSTSIELEITGTGKNGIEIDHKGPWKTCGHDEESICRPNLWINTSLNSKTLTFPFFTPDPAPPEGEEFSVRIGTAGNGLYVGPSASDVYLDYQKQGKGIPGGTGNVRTHRGVTVDRMRYTGNAVEPYIIEILVDNTADNDAVTYKGKFTFSTTCTMAEEDRVETQLPCGHGNPDDPDRNFFEDLNLKLSQDRAGFHPCPESILSLYREKGGVLRGDADKRTVSVGNATPLPCVRTENGTFACGATTESVEVDGCSWRVDALYSYFGYQISGKSESCGGEVKYCHNTIAP